MPDWSYHPLKKLFLDKISATSSREGIHKSMNMIASIPGGKSVISFLGHMQPPSLLSKEIAHSSFSSPVGLSSMIDPKLSGIRAFPELGFGFIEIGPIVLTEPREQLTPKMQEQHILFVQHQERLSLKLALRELTKLQSKIPIFAKIDAEVSSDEWNMIIQQLTPYVDAFIASYEQIRDYSKQATSSSVRPIYASFFADHIPEKEIKQLLALTDIPGIVIQAPRNTIDHYWHEKVDANPSVAAAVKQVKDLYPDLIVITSGSVDTPDHAYTLVHAGADLIMLTDGYVNAGPGLPKRIHERLLFEDTEIIETTKTHWSLLFGISILIGGLIALYFALTSIILPYDEAFIGLTRADLFIINSRILAFMSHDRMALAGTMLSGSIIYIQIARHGLKFRMHWAKIAFHSAAISGFLGIFLFIGYGYFDWLHGLFWLILLPPYYFSLKQSREAKSSPSAYHETNDKAWKLGNYGQLMFVMLGFAILVGGVVIATIGITSVFVTTDLSYMCMSPQMLDDINQKLIPVIAHDRAGFGGALISVGLLVLMLSLWGFRRGARWVWNTMAMGALPAFVAGIGTHFYIGYTNFIHLLPVYFLVILYILGLLLSYPTLKYRKQ